MPALDLVVISGDLCDTPTKEEYDHLKGLLAPLKIPFIGIPGNHDDRAMMRAALPEFGHHSPRPRHAEAKRGELLDVPLLRFKRAGQAARASLARQLLPGSMPRLPRAQPGRLFCFSTIRLSSPAFGTWTCRI